MDRLLVVCASLLAGILVLAPAAAGAAELVVNAISDAVDSSPGNGICLSLGGTCTLRAAVQEANALAGADVIRLPAGSHSLTIAGADEDAAMSGDLDLVGTVDLIGAGSDVTSIVQTAHDRVIEVGADATPTTASLTGVRIQGGSAEDLATSIGGGILHRRDELSLDDVFVTGNSADDGGGIFNGAMLGMVGSTVTGNTVGEFGSGGGVSNGNTSWGFPAVSAEIEESAIYGNEGQTSELDSANADFLLVYRSTIGVGSLASSRAVRIYNTTAATLRDVTLLGRLQASGFDVGFTALTLDNTVLSVCNVAVVVAQTNVGVNAAEDATCGLGASAVIADPLGLEPLGDHGGPTFTAPPQRTSVLVDAAPGCSFRLDQRGLGRPQDGDGDGTPACDVGAVELPELGAAGSLAAGLALRLLRRRREVSRTR